MRAPVVGRPLSVAVELPLCATVLTLAEQADPPTDQLWPVPVQLWSALQLALSPPSMPEQVQV